MLFDKTIFGPIQSRRLGSSLGVNLLPVDGKICSFDCIYCECGYNAQGKKGTTLPTRQEVQKQLEERLKSMQKQGAKLDVITFAGNGEPTIHPQFAQIIDDTISLRNIYYPQAKVSVLSNATQIGTQSVFDALLKVDNNILKLDSVVKQTLQRMNQPGAPFDVELLIEQLCRFKGQLIVQTMFVRGEIDGKSIDNTTPEEVNLWINAVEKIKPQQVMIYTIDRPTPEHNLQKITIDELYTVALELRKRGLEVSVTG